MFGVPRAMSVRLPMSNVRAWGVCTQWPREAALAAMQRVVSESEGVNCGRHRGLFDGAARVSPATRRGFAAAACFRFSIYNCTL